jgi:hypothetical protein
VVSAAVSAVVGVLSLVGIVHAVAGLTTAVLLFVGGANEWYAGPGSHQPPDQPPDQPPSDPPPWQPRTDQEKPPVW